jgi:hypothetical protein
LLAKSGSLFDVARICSAVLFFDKSASEVALQPEHVDILQPSANLIKSGIKSTPWQAKTAQIPMVTGIHPAKICKIFGQRQAARSFH